MRILKWSAYVLLAVLCLAVGLALFNWEKLVRLNAVNTLFSEEKIVSNFSQMNTLFLHKPVVAEGVVIPFERRENELPEKFTSGEQIRDVAEWLELSATTSLLVLQDGRIAHESYHLETKPDDLRISWSVAKSFLSAAFGVAISEGKIDIEKPVDDYVPEFKNSAYSGVKVRNVLNMASGVRFNEDYLDFWSDINRMGRVLAIGGSMDEFALDISERQREQGLARQYVSIDTHVLAMVLRAATGRTLPDYMAEKIMKPLGMEKQPYYLSDSDGNAFALGGLNMTTRDYARFGQLFLQNGKWQGNQVIPAGWVVSSTLASAPEPANGSPFSYGYQWWIPPSSIENGGDFLARGIYGQYIYINPRTRTVIVKTAANRNFRKYLPDGGYPSLINVDMFRAISTSFQTLQ